MPVLVDGDNLLGTWPGHTRSEAEKRDLARVVARASREQGRRIVLVFDGEAPYPLGADVAFSGRGRRADDVILDTLRAQDDRRGWTVVTNDKSLGDQCRWLGARVERCEAFRTRLGGPEAGEKPGSEEDLAYWERVFGEEPSDEA